jgi:ATP-dependent Zn protease
MSKLSDEQRRVAAHHEAGHAVIAYVLGIPIRAATVLGSSREDDAAGSVSTGRLSETLESWRQRGKRNRDGAVVVIAHIIMLMAGRVAEEEICKAWMEDGDRGDLNIIDGMLTTVPLPYSREHLRKKTRSLVIRHRKTIERVAIALMMLGTLSASDVTELMNMRAARQ